MSSRSALQRTLTWGHEPDQVCKAGGRETRRGSVSVGSDLRARREAIVRDHVPSENRREYDLTIETFDHPRYEIIPTGEVCDGEDEVRTYFAATREGFRDQRKDVTMRHHAGDAVIREFGV